MSNKKPKILMVGSYPILNPVHGGQRRTYEIYKNYLELGYEVEYIGAYLESNYQKKDRSKQDIVIDINLYKDNLNFINHQLGFLAREDIVIPRLILNIKKINEQLINKIKDFDIIQFEQPYMFGSINSKQLVNKTIIFSSHNIEEDFFETLKAKRYIKQQTKLLIEIVKFIIVCSESEKQYYLKINQYKEIMFIPNAVGIKNSTEESNLKIKNFLQKKEIKEYVVFVSSVHQPNFDGYMKIIGHRLGFLKEGQFIIIVGGLSSLFKIYLGHTKNPKDIIIEDKIRYYAKPDDSELQSLIELSKGIILPIVYGSGTNLKTAEALYSSKNIVGTKFAFRGYEDYMEYPNVFLTNNSDKFIEYIKKIFTLDDPVIKYNKDKLTWSYFFKKINKQLCDLINE